ADGNPAEVLESRGLTRSGAYYVLDAESEFLEKLVEVQPLYDQLRGLFTRLAVIAQSDSEYDEIDRQRDLVNERIGNVQAEIDAFPSLSNNLLKQRWQELLELERQLRVQWDELNRERNLRWRALTPDWQKEKLSQEFRERRADFLKKSRDLRALV